MTNPMCPNCERRVHLPEEPRLGHKVTCQYCGKTLEVISLDPVELNNEFGDNDSYDYDDEGDEDD